MPITRSCRHRPTVWLGGFALFAVGSAVSLPADSAEPRPVAEEQADDPRRSPGGVVRAQMQAMAAWRNDPDAAARVFQYASPANRAATGPLERFRKMAESEPYAALLDNSGWTIGEPFIAERVAVVLVTVINDRGQLRAFRFYLSRPPADDGHWMTDAVLVLPVEGSNSALSPTTPSDAAI